MAVSIVDEFSIDICREYPYSIFVFGDNLERRRKQIQNASGRRVKILECWATEVAARTVEKAVHRMYSRRRKQGEWFTHMSYMDVQCAGYGLTQCNHDGTLRYRDILDELEQKTDEMCKLFWPERFEEANQKVGTTENKQVSLL